MKVSPGYETQQMVSVGVITVDNNVKLMFLGSGIIHLL
jgi:hypothetical protein